MLDNRIKLIYMTMVSVLYLSACQACYIYKLQKLHQSGQVIMGIVLAQVIYLIGPFGLTLMNSLIHKMFYRVLFFSTSMAGMIFIILGSLTLEYLTDDSLIITSLILTLLYAPFYSLFFCTFNLYINELSSSQNKGVYFGIAYSLLCTSSFFGAIYVQVTFQRSQVYPRFYIQIMHGIGIIASLLYWFVQESNNKTPEISAFDKHMNQTFSRDTRIPEQRHVKLTFDGEFYKIWRCFFIPNIRYLLTNLLQIGILSSYTFIMTNIMIRAIHMIKEIDSDTTLVYVQVYYGIGQFIGGITSGMLGDLHDRCQTLMNIQYLIIIGFIQAALAIYFRSVNLMYSFIFFAGLSQSAQITTTFSYFASQFKDYASILVMCVWIFSLGHGVATFIFSAFCDITNIYSLYSAILFVLITTVINIIFLSLYRKRINTNQDEKPLMEIV